MRVKVMTVHILQNYLRTYRRRCGLSQAEVAYLLGCKDGGKICRHEHLLREPSLQTALAYEVIYGAPVRELFAGLFRKVERATIRRVGTLGRELQAKAPTRLITRKLETLGAALKTSRVRGSGKE
jgi:DNA-binding XRE family transcriptional regulator